MLSCCHEQTASATLDRIFQGPAPTSLEWRDIEALFLAAGAPTVEGRGVTGAFRVERCCRYLPSAPLRERGETVPGARCAPYLGTGRDQTINTMTYRGYAARIEYSDEDQCLIGHIGGINDVVGFHGDSVAELRTAFEDAVEDYLETCEKLGRAPQKPYSGKLMLRVPPEVHAAVAAAAQVSGKSINQWAAEAFTKAVRA